MVVVIPNNDEQKGFVEGGDLHGIISIRALEVSKKSELTAKYVPTVDTVSDLSSPTNYVQIEGTAQQPQVRMVFWYGQSVERVAKAS